MNEAFEHLIAPVVRHEGTVARLMGDAILAFFGAPTAHEDDPQRAVMAGLEIVSSVTGFREKLAGERGLDLQRARRHQHRSSRRGGRRLGAQAGVLGDGGRGERRRSDGADGRARHRADHRGHLPAGRRSVRGRAARRRGAQREASPGGVLPGARSPGRAVDRSRRPATRRPSRRTPGGDGGDPCRAGGSSRRSRIGPVAHRRPRDRQEPADRGGQCDLGGDGAGRRSPMGLLAMRAVRHDAAVRAISATDPGTRRRQGDGSRRDRAGEDRRADGEGRPGGVGRAQRAGRASAPRRRARGRAASGGRGVPTCGHRARGRLDPGTGRTATHRLRGSALVRPCIARAGPGDHRARRGCADRGPGLVPPRSRGRLVGVQGVGADRARDICDGARARLPLGGAE